MRTRSIKPFVFNNPKLGTADPLLTILLMGLWCMADREGLLEDTPQIIHSTIFPYRKELNIDELLNQLQQENLIYRHHENDIKIIKIINFKYYQKVHHTEKESTLKVILLPLTVINGELTVKNRKTKNKEKTSIKSSTYDENKSYPQAYQLTGISFSCNAPARGIFYNNNYNNINNLNTKTKKKQERKNKNFSKSVDLTDITLDHLQDGMTQPLQLAFDHPDEPDLNRPSIAKSPDEQKADLIGQGALEVLEFLCDAANRRFRPVPQNLKHIIARLKDGFSVQNCKTVIMRKYHDWENQPHMLTYLRPATIFNATNFEQYFSQTQIIDWNKP
jgi:uncharacterized phage protein (TIGR02220 family)